MKQGRALVSIIVISADFPLIRWGSKIVYQNRSCINWHSFASLADNVAPWIFYRGVQLNSTTARQEIIVSIRKYLCDSISDHRRVLAFISTSGVFVTPEIHLIRTPFPIPQCITLFRQPSFSSSFSKQLQLACIYLFPSGFF